MTSSYLLLCIQPTGNGFSFGRSHQNAQLIWSSPQTGNKDSMVCIVAVQGQQGPSSLPESSCSHWPALAHFLSYFMRSPEANMKYGMYVPI
jgi:hypothetical protein